MMSLLFWILVITATASPQLGGQYDYILNTGLEKLIEDSSVIVAGPIADFKSTTTEWVRGDEQTPVAWTVTGKLVSPQALKGTAPREVAFERDEEDEYERWRPMWPDEETAWQYYYGDLHPHQHVVLFFGGSQEKPVVTVLPSGPPAPELTTLVREIVRIQGIVDRDTQNEAWRELLARTREEQGVGASLRSLLTQGVAWPVIEPHLAAILSEPVITYDLKAYDLKSYIIVFVEAWLVQANSVSHRLAAVRFLARCFVKDRDLKTSMWYLGVFRGLLQIAHRFGAQEHRIRRIIIDAMNARASAAPLEPSMASYYQHIAEIQPEVMRLP